MKRKPWVISYLRFSRPEQWEGDSYRRQREKALAWCEKNNLELTESLEDLGLSAFQGKNAREGALRDFLDAIDCGRVQPGDYLIVESLDRLSRQQLGIAQTLVQSILLAGVNIVTLSPERVFTSSGTNDIGQAIEILIVLARAHDESQMKSVRVGDAWAKKRDRALEEKLTKRGCSWLRLSDDRKEFEIIPERVALVERMFELAEGVGAKAIAKIFNDEGIQTFRSEEKRKKHPRWRESTIRSTLRSKAVLGYFQPTRNGEPTGAPIEDYYPAIISKDQFYRVQASIESRHSGGGPVRKKISNLFKNLVFDKSGEPFHYRESNPGESYLRTPTNSVPYNLFEATMLLWASDLDVSAVLPNDRANTASSKIPELVDRAKGLENEIAELTSRVMQKGSQGGVLYDMLEKLEEERVAVLNRLDEAKAQASTTASQALRSIHDLMDKLSTVDEEKVWAIRARLRRLLKRVVDRVECRSKKLFGGGYQIGIIIQLSNGQKRVLGVRGVEAKWSKHAFSLNIEGASNLEENSNFQTFDLSSIRPELDKYKNNLQQINTALKLGKTGIPLNEIATQTGLALTSVSRLLIRHGQRRTKRKPKDHPHHMNWHQSARGWVKTHNRKRFYVGCGTLRDLYPHLIENEGKDECDTWRAANQWWEDHTKDQLKPS